MVCQAKEPRQVKLLSFAFSASKCVHVNDPSKKGTWKHFKRLSTVETVSIFLNQLFFCSKKKKTPHFINFKRASGQFYKTFYLGN